MSYADEYFLNLFCGKDKNTFCRFIVLQPYLITPVIRITQNQAGVFSFLGTLPLQKSDRAREIFLLCRTYFPFFLIICTAGLCVLSTSLALMNIDSRDCANTFSLAFRNPVGAMCSTLIAYMGQIVFWVHMVSSD